MNECIFAEPVWVQQCAQLDLALSNVPWRYAVPVQVSLITELPFPGAQTLHNALHCWLHASVLTCNQARKVPPEGRAPKTALRRH